MDTQLIPVLLAAASLALAHRRDWLRLAAASVLVLSLAVPALATPTPPLGDYPEYHQTQLSFMRHATPDLTPQDTATYEAQGRQESLSTLRGVGYFVAKNKRTYSYHFWMSALATVPLGFVLKLCGLSSLRAFALLNALLIALAYYALLYWSGLGERKRLVFAAFWILSPVTWYLAWPSAEVWSASLVVLAIVLFTRRKFAWAVALASLASMQNQPILVFSTLLAVASACTLVRQSAARKATGVALAWGLGFVPTVFYFMLFGTPNLIAANGEASVHFVTLQKIIGTYFDLNQGMIIYLPGLVLLWIGTLVLAIRRKSFSILLPVAAVGMAVLSATTANWNSGAVGLMRYAVWQMPVLAWGAIAVLSSGKRWERRALYSLAASQLVVALVVLAWPAYAPDYLHHGPVATYVLNHRPALYSPDVDIFWDRTTHFEVADSVKNQSGTITESIGFSGPDGLFRKLLTLDSEVPYAAGKLGISEEQFRRDSYSAGRPGLWYTDLYPPR